ncbi:MAG TPA: S41 family peptidase [Acidobacteriaceae bacterium]|nr:S41 family peptidase [Acidobacteriaceae bacterium]
MSIRTRRTFFSLVVFFSVCALGGMILSQQVGAQSAADESTFRDSLKSFGAVYDVVAKNYAEPLTGEMPDKAIYDGAIPEMLHTLDPHSSFYDPKAYARMKEDQHGKYYGVGMLIQPQNGKVIVVYPIEGSPAFRAGIHPGDIIAGINGQSAAGLGSDEVANRLKGPRGTSVSVTVTRVGSSTPLTFQLTRDEIPNASIDLAYFIRPGVGYIHIRQFQETTGREFDDAINKFGADNLKGLVLDLRGNPGGVLVEAVAVCDRLLKRGQVIVSQRGRAFPEQVYRATHGNDGETFPIVVLVNHGTASAAEIVSGALQDHDRALIAGETTFGKGLVQTVYTLSDNTGLALTTYHYYTPSGRLIQRNYNGVSLYDYYYNHNKPQNDKDREVKLTDSGRTVYGGGGIAPDVKVEPPKSTPFEDILLEHNAFLGFTEEYLAHRNVNKEFQVDDAVLGDFKQYLASKNIEYTPQELNANLDWVKTNIKSKLFTTQFGQTAGLKVEAEWDPMIQQATSLMPQAAQLEQHVQQVLAEKEAALSHSPARAQ